MSQAGMNNTSNGPSPPDVPTSFTTDVADNDASIFPGNAEPSGNNLEILGRDTNQDNENGIRTDADPQDGKFVYVELTNRIQNELASLIGTGTADTPLLLLDDAACYNFETKVVAVASPAGTSGAGFSLFGTVVCSGGQATIINTVDKIANKSTTPLDLSDCDVNMSIDLITTNLVNLTVTGSAASALVWGFVSIYTKVDLI